MNWLPHLYNLKHEFQFVISARNEFFSLSFPVLSFDIFHGERWESSSSLDRIFFRRSRPVDGLQFQHMMAPSAWCGWLSVPEFYGLVDKASDFWLRWTHFPSVKHRLLVLSTQMTVFNFGGVDWFFSRFFRIPLISASCL